MELKNPTTVNSSWNSEIRSNMKHENILYSLSIVRYLTTTKKDFIPLSEIHREDSERSMKKKSVFFCRRIRTHKLYYNIFKLGNKCIKKVELDNQPHCDFHVQRNPENEQMNCRIFREFYIED